MDKYSYTRRAGFWVGHISNRNIQRHISSVRWKCTMLGERGSVLSNMISIHSILGKTSPHQDTNNMANKMGHLNIAFYNVFLSHNRDYKRLFLLRSHISSCLNNTAKDTKYRPFPCIELCCYGIDLGTSPTRLHQ